MVTSVSMRPGFRPNTSNIEFACDTNYKRAGSPCTGFTNYDTTECVPCDNDDFTSVCPVGTFTSNTICDGDYPYTIKEIIDLTCQNCIQGCEPGLTFVDNYAQCVGTTRTDPSHCLLDEPVDGVCPSGFYILQVNNTYDACAACKYGESFTCPPGWFRKGNKCNGTGTNDTQICNILPPFPTSPRILRLLASEVGVAMGCPSLFVLLRKLLHSQGRFGDMSLLTQFQYVEDGVFRRVQYSKRSLLFAMNVLGCFSYDTYNTTQAWAEPFRFPDNMARIVDVDVFGEYISLLYDIVVPTL